MGGTFSMPRVFRRSLTAAVVVILIVVHERAGLAARSGTPSRPGGDHESEGIGCRRHRRLGPDHVRRCYRRADVPAVGRGPLQLPEGGGRLSAARYTNR